jgi:hypothetical protein
MSLKFGLGTHRGCSRILNGEPVPTCDQWDVHRVTASPEELRISSCHDAQVPHLQVSRDAAGASTTVPGEEYDSLFCYCTSSNGNTGTPMRSHYRTSRQTEPALTGAATTEPQHQDLKSCHILQPPSPSVAVRHPSCLQVSFEQAQGGPLRPRLFGS